MCLIFTTTLYARYFNMIVKETKTKDITNDNEEEKE